MMLLQRHQRCGWLWKRIKSKKRVCLFVLAVLVFGLLLQRQYRTLLNHTSSASPTYFRSEDAELPVTKERQDKDDPAVSSKVSSQQQQQQQPPSCLLFTDNEDDNDRCLQQLAQQLARTWKPHPWQSWCYSPAAQKGVQQEEKQGSATSTTDGDDDDDRDAAGGLVLIKVPKSASSTMAGMVLRIQHRRNCTVTWRHQLAREYHQAQITYENATTTATTTTHRIAPIRHPTSRALSSLYFHKVSFHQQHSGRVNPGFLLKHLKQAPSNYILDYTRPTLMSSSWQQRQQQNNPAASLSQQDRTLEVVHAVQETAAWYDFLFVVDRFDESLLVWSRLTGLPLADLVTLSSSKRGGSWYASAGRCVSLVPPPKLLASKPTANQTTTPNTNNNTHDDVSIDAVLLDFFNSPRWKHAHTADHLLHAVATLSLGRTIQQVYGNNRNQQENHARQTALQADLAKFRAWRRDLQQACDNETHFPCSSSGQYQPTLANCYVRDFGCGYPCLDRILQQQQQQQQQRDVPAA